MNELDLRSAAGRANAPVREGRAWSATETPSVFQVNPQTGVKIDRLDLSGDINSLESLIGSPDGSTRYSAADRDPIYNDLVTIQLGSPGGVVHDVDPSLHSGFRDIEGLAFLSTAIVRQMQRDPVAPLEPRFDWRLVQNRPNPFNPSTTLEVVTPSAGPERSIHMVPAR